jgi:hypothetical protein
VKTIAAAVAALAVAVSATAPAAPAQLVLEARTPVPLLTLTELNSKANRQGDRFELEVRDDVTVGGMIAIPKGSRAFGEIAHHNPKGPYGRSGGLELRLLNVVVDGRIIRLDGDERLKGSNAVGAAVITGAAWGAIGGFISGRNAVLPAGTELIGFVHRDIPLIVPER